MIGKLKLLPRPSGKTIAITLFAIALAGLAILNLRGNDLLIALKQVNWYLEQATFTEIDFPLALTIPLILMATPFLFYHELFHTDRIRFQRAKIFLALLPAIWITIGLIGAMNPVALSNWPAYTNITLLICFFSFGIFQIFKNKGMRVVTFFLVLINSYFALLITFIASMAISGSWL